MFTIDQVVTNNCWKSAWPKTNTIGKQVILQRLTDIICSTDVPTDTASSVEVLNYLLDMIESEQTAHTVDELKSTTTHQLMALTGLMFYNTPTSKLLPTVVKSIYGKLKDEEWTQAAQLWRDSERQARLACYFAARIIHVTRSSHCPHFGAPVSLLSAVFILWIYSKLAQRCPDGLLLTLASHPPVPYPVSNPDWWDRTYRRVPDFRPVNRELDLSDRQQGAVFAFVGAIMVGGCWFQSVSQCFVLHYPYLSVR